jgi:hypothetical protein
MAAAAIVPPQDPQQPAPLSEAQRLIDTFIAPAKTFTDLRRSAMWWAPFLLIVIVSVLFVSVVDQKIGFRKVFDNIIQQQPKQAERIENLPTDQRESMLQKQTAFTKGISYAAPVIGLIVYAIFAGVFFATLKFAANADVTFSSMYALIVYTRLPELLRALLATLSIVAGVSSDSFNIENPLATNAGYFIDPSGSAVLRALLTPLDVITIWTLVLVAIGITCIGNVKRGTAFGVVFGWFGVYILGKVAFAAIFS